MKEVNPMRNVLFFVCLCAALTTARGAAAQQYVSRAEFEQFKGQVQGQLQEMAALQRETLAALRGGAQSAPIQFASATRVVPARYAADDDSVDLGEDACASWSPEGGLPETGRIRISTYGSARVLVPAGDRGYLAAGRGVQSSPAPRSASPASYGGPIRSASYHRGLISSPYANMARFPAY